MPLTQGSQLNKANRLQDLEPSRTAVLNFSLSSANSRRAYDYAIRTFVDWYCAEPRLGFNRSVVSRYRSFLEHQHYSSSTINLRLGAVRRLAYEAADNGPLSADLAAGSRRVRNVKTLGARIGNWLTAEQAREMLAGIDTTCFKGKRDYALLAVLVSCGLPPNRNSADLWIEDLQQRDGHWLLSDLTGKGGRIRTVPVPNWVKGAVDEWTGAAMIEEGAIFRPIDRAGHLKGSKIGSKTVWGIVRRRAAASGLKNIAPHDLRRTCARLCHEAGGGLDQIQFLLGHASIQTTERYIGCKQKLRNAVNDRIGIEALA